MYQSAAVDKLRTEGVTATVEQLAHILPLMPEHINLWTLRIRPMDEILQGWDDGD